MKIVLPLKLITLENLPLKIIFIPDCILERLFETFLIKKPNLNFIVDKNIPVQSGLGSASTNAAAMFRILERMNIYKINDIKDTRFLGSDIPLFLNEKRLSYSRNWRKNYKSKLYPKYYFLLVKPKTNCSTKKNVQNNCRYNDLDYNVENDHEDINEYDVGNDFEKIIKRY